MIIATAGHVDHGKTRLVEALTGVDTDTLAEEKKRGLSIDIGFAYLPLEDAFSIGFIDVPGHERFIRNALCGLAAADFVLLLVAADDGPMPQTREHLSIIELLGVGQGAIVISKADRVSASRIERVHDELSDMLAQSPLAGWSRYVVSALSRQGVDELHERLLARALTSPLAAASDCSETNFRMSIDRAFEIRGAGLVVTGTIAAGSVRQGDPVTIAGSTMQLRVRALRVQDEEMDCGRQGQRCAINLAGSGLHKDQVRRGSWVTSARAVAPVERFDAELRIVNDSPRPLRHWTPVHLHLAAAQTTARVAVLADGAIAPGEQGLVQVVGDRPVGAAFGDRFIIRDQSARVTLGGGRVLDIFPPRRGRARPERIVWLRQMRQDDAREALLGLLCTSYSGVDLARFAVNRNLTREAEAEICEVGDMVVLNLARRRVGFPAQMAKAHCDQILQALRDCHRDHAGAAGFTREQIRARMDSKPATELFEGFLDRLLRQSVVRVDAAGYSLSTHRPGPNAADVEAWSAIEATLSANGLRPMTFAELAQATRLSAPRLRALVARAARDGLIVKLSAQLLLLPSRLEEMRKLIAKLAGQKGEQGFSVADFRDASGIGRNRCIEILECCDARGITLRGAQGRQLLPAAERAFAKLQPAQ
ncbi:MAG: selenocysteine-specific translation elongation factor [Gammaproteobacteria bacterium]|nr:selenocysteine-specific translation elongation factor [Gammaproteobacteria bacterium]